MPSVPISEDIAHPASQCVASCIWAVAGSAEKNARSFKPFARCKPGTKGTRIRIQSKFPLQRCAFARQRQVSASAKLNARIPPLLLYAALLNEEIRNNLA